MTPSFPISRWLRMAVVAVVAAAVGCATQTVPEGQGGGLSPTGAAGKPLVTTPRGPAIANELVVRLMAGAKAGVIDDVAAEAGGEVVWHGPYTGLYVLRFHDLGGAAVGAEILASQPQVAEVERNVLTYGTGIGTSPGLTDLQWNLPAMGLAPDPAADPRAAGITVAVLDTGVAYENFIGADGTVYAQAPDLSAVPFVPGYDFINDDAHPNDDQGHGTHVAGVIAARGGIAAVAPGATILPVKVLDDANVGTELALAEGIAFATANDADIINMSLSFAPSYFPSPYLQAVVDQATQQGMVMVAAAGNHGQDLVTYPAAFRDVIAVGASVLGDDFGHRGWVDWGRGGFHHHGWGHHHGDDHHHHGDGDHHDHDTRWEKVADHLERADYSNRGYLVDVLAPGGVIDGDLDGDGYPEAILAQTFLGDDPTAFQYVFYAGTSQAAAQISGLAALILAENPDLSPREVRAVIGDTADRHGHQVLDRKSGRGFVAAAEALDAAGDDDVAAPEFFAAIHLSIESRFGTLDHHGHGGGARRFARAEVEIIDDNGDPVPHVTVYGAFTGATYEADTARTDRHGIAVFRSPSLAGNVVAFQVEAIADQRHGTFDRPAGFLRIDSCSLELVSEFVSEITGQGIGTSPGAPLSLRYADTDRGEIPSVTLLNYSWGLATVPMAVAVDAAWFADTYPEAQSDQIVSFGAGIGDSPLLLLADESFPQPREAASSDTCIDLLVTTYSTGQGIGTSPGGSEGGGIGTSPGETEGGGIGTSPGETEGDGIGTSPGETEGDGIGTSPGDTEADGIGTSPGFGIGTSPGFTSIAVDPNGNCQSLGLCDVFSAVIGDIWTAAGIGTSPGWTEDSGLSEALFDHLVNVIDAYVGFGSLRYAAPVSDYGELLIAAGIGLTPFADDESQGVGAAAIAP
ncbi:MAG TPA: S8 family serine peptidase [Kofleriaceae bacterium]|nr:S8 family serine peptidase [Kofleriaceae bacterium]